MPESRRALSVSVVIPVKDDAERLRRCLRALESQSRPADETLVVNNASLDGSAEVARSAGARVVFCDQPGIPAASARGYDEARGDLVLRLDADCLPGRDWIAGVVRAFERRPHVQVFTGGARFIDGPRALRGPLAAAYLGAYIAVTGPALGHLPVFGSNLALRHSAWQSVRSAVHRDDPELHDDLDLAFHLGERHRIRRLAGSSMGISMRPLGSARGMARRVRRGARTVLAHWPRDLPPVRWMRLAFRRALHAARVPTPAASRLATSVGRRTVVAECARSEKAEVAA